MTFSPVRRRVLGTAVVPPTTAVSPTSSQQFATDFTFSAVEAVLPNGPVQKSRMVVLTFRSGAQDWETPGIAGVSVPSEVRYYAVRSNLSRSGFARRSHVTDLSRSIRPEMWTRATRPLPNEPMGACLLRTS
jgi:hypothetical protein